MIERYMEKDLFRQLVLCEHLYKYAHISIQKMADLLNVFPKTIENDVQKMSFILEDLISYKEKSKQNYYVTFDSQVTLPELRRVFYQSSIFLRVCQIILDGKWDYLDIVENYFVSVSKAYALIHQAGNFFKDHGLKYENKQLAVSEIEWRLLQLNIRTKLDEGVPQSIPLEFESACMEFIEMIEKKYKNTNFSEEEQLFLNYGLQLSYLRQKIRSVEFDALYTSYMSEAPFQKVLRSFWENSRLKEFLQEEEFLFVYFLFKSCDYSFEETLEKYGGIENAKRMVLIDDPSVVVLTNRLSEYFNTSLAGDAAYEQAFIQLLRTCWSNYQSLLPQPIYLVKPELSKFTEDITAIMEEWGRGLEVVCRFEKNLIYRFVNDYARLHYEKNSSLQILIVTDSPIKFLVYQDYLKKSWLELAVCDTQFIKIADALEASGENTVILCEANYYYDDLKAPIPIIPISLASITQPIFGHVFYQGIQSFLSYV